MRASSCVGESGEEQGENQIKGKRSGRDRELLPSVRSQVTFHSPLSRPHTHEQIKKTTRMGKLFNNFALREGLNLVGFRFFRDDGHVSKTVSGAWKMGLEGGGMEWEEVSTCSYANTQIEITPTRFSFFLLTAHPGE